MQKEKRAAEDEMVRYECEQMDMNLSKFWEIVKDRGGWHAAVQGVAKNGIQLSN